MSKRVFYPKMPTLYQRDVDTFKVVPGLYTFPEFGIIDPWVVCEKIDGMNASFIFYRDRPDKWDFRGRTENTNWSQEKYGYMIRLGEWIAADVDDIMVEHDLQTYEIFGELYGPGIQKGGVYGDTLNFVMFDVRVDGTVWLDYQTVVDTAYDRLDLGVPPAIGVMPKHEIVSLVKKGFASLIGEGDTLAEGVVARPQCRLYNARGERVMWKLKHSDFA